MLFSFPIAGRPPLKVYLPRTPGDVVGAVKEARALGQVLTVTGGDPARPGRRLAHGTALLSTRALDRVVDLDEADRTVTVEAGAVLAAVDAYLLARGFGLPVGGGAAPVTAGGFASVGGVGPASLRHGLFSDNVRELEFVTWDGALLRCGRTRAPDVFRRVLGGAGGSGIITRLVLDILPLDKEGTLLENAPVFAGSLEGFIARTTPRLLAPGDARLALGVYLELPMGGGLLGFGQYSSYRDATPGAWKAVTREVSRRSRRGLGQLTRWLPHGPDALRDALGLARVLLHPRQASVQDVEALPGVGVLSDGSSRGLGVLVPVERYGALLRELFALFREVRARSGGAPVLQASVMPIRSATLGQGDPARRFCALRFHLGPALEAERGDGLLARVDALCAGHGARRAPDTKTSQEPVLRREVDEVDLPARDPQHPAVEQPRGLRAVD